jgi:endonuclease/exonuclease/phosphatase family metal-dependent hydrolase
VPYTYNITTLNVNGITSTMKIRMLHDFIRQHNIDVICLQEIVNGKVCNTAQYTPYINVGIEGRGTALIVKDCYHMQNIKQIPNGRGTAGELDDTTIINIYALAGAEKRKERETFYNAELIYLLQPTRENMIIAGEFNCVLSHEDCTGQPALSKLLQNLISGLKMHDSWQQKGGTKTYSHYITTSASEIDRIYVTENLIKYKKHADTLAAAFTDHMAVIIHIELPSGGEGRGNWKINTQLLQDDATKASVRVEWAKWKGKVNYYASKTEWCCRYVKPRMRAYFGKLGKQKRDNQKRMENFYC